MSRKRIEHVWLPEPYHRMRAAWLPRDIRMGWSPSDPKGTLLYGWDLTSDTRQLWRIVTTGQDGEAEFVGFVSGRLS